MTTLVSGMVFARLPDGGIGDALPGAVLEFIKEATTAALSKKKLKPPLLRRAAYTATSDARGRYSISLPTGRYYLRATHESYEDSTSAPGFLVATLPTLTCNFFLREPQVTTVIVVRHGEKLDPSSTSPSEPLSDIGLRRANALRDTLFRAGVTAIHVTDTVRARGTAEPLATAFRLVPAVYSSSTAVASAALSGNAGDVTLIVAHSNTITEVITALGASGVTGLVNDYDTMFVVSRAGSEVNVVSLQYGEDSGDVASKNSARAMTLLLVGTGAAGGPEPSQLLHAALGAGVSAIYVGDGHSAMVAPLATALGLTPVSYTSGATLSLVDTLLTQHASHTVVVSGTSDDLRAVILALRGELPILYTTDVDHLIVLTRFASGAVRVLPMRL